MAERRRTHAPSVKAAHRLRPPFTGVDVVDGVLISVTSEPLLPRVTHAQDEHEMNWIEAIQGKTEASSPFSYASALTEVMLLGLVALRTGQGRRIQYDGAAMRVVDAPEANEFLSREYPAGWEL